MKRVLHFLILLSLFVIGAITYTWPGPMGIWEGRTDAYMSDGTDPTTHPFQFDMLHRGFLENPSLFFYGAYPNSRLDAPEGSVGWYSTTEKLAGLLFPFFVPIEQVGVLLGLVLLVANGLSFYGMGRALGWNRVLSFGLSMAWAFSSYTRARALVHVTLAGIYGIPLGFLGLIILMKDRSRKGIIKSALCFLGCATSSHYYLIFLTFFSPFLFFYYLSSPEVRQQWKKALPALAGALLPAALFLTYNFLNPVPAEFQKHVSSVLPATGESRIWPHPFLTIYSANLEDYFSGDIAIGLGDVIPWRGDLTSNIRKNMKMGNYHEHAQGIRWVVWGGLILALGYLLRRRGLFPIRSAEGAGILVLIIFGVFSISSSLAPDWGVIWGPSLWIQTLMSQIRVPNRAGIFAHFSILMIIGIIAHNWWKVSKASLRLKQGVMVAFLILMIVDFPPFVNPMPMAEALPSRVHQFAKKPGACGLGFHFPYISGVADSISYYYLLQSLRGTDCAVLNSAGSSLRDYRMHLLYGYNNQEFLNKIINNDAGIREHLVQFARCNKLSWVIFDPRTPQAFVRDFCQSWGGQTVAEDLCLNSAPAEIIPPGLPDECLSKTQSPLTK